MISFDCSAAVTPYLCVSIPPAVRPSLAEKSGLGIFNVRNDLRACCANEGDCDRH